MLLKIGQLKAHSGPLRAHVSPFSGVPMGDGAPPSTDSGTQSHSVLGFLQNVASTSPSRSASQGKQACGTAGVLQITPAFSFGLDTSIRPSFRKREAGECGLAGCPGKRNLGEIRFECDLPGYLDLYIPFPPMSRDCRLRPVCGEGDWELTTRWVRRDRTGRIYARKST